MKYGNNNGSRNCIKLKDWQMKIAKGLIYTIVFEFYTDPLNRKLNEKYIKVALNCKALSHITNHLNLLMI